MTIIRTMKDPSARKRRVIEMFYLVLIEVLIDLLSVAAPSDQIWGKNYEQHLKGQPFVRTLLRAARDTTEHLEGVDGYTKMTQKWGRTDGRSENTESKRAGLRPDGKTTCGTTLPRDCGKTQ